jgi:4-amino-4-deoxy-L-arabinose transferase-like glycosyltransferase
MSGRHWFWAGAGLLLAAMGAAQVTSALQETQTWDEGTHLAAGYSYLKTGDFRMNREHPPLFKLLCALPLVALDPKLPLEGAAWREGLQEEFGDTFMYKNRVPAEKMLLAARLATIALTLGLGLAMALWTRRKFGAVAALAALALYAFDPNLIAHGHYVTGDLLATACVFLACIAWARFVETKRWRDLGIAGVVLGLAAISKFSALFLLPVLAALYWIRRWQEGRGRLTVRHFAASAAVAGAIVVAVVGLAYGPATIRSFHGTKLRRVVDPTTTAGAILSEVGKRLGLPAHPYLVGLYDFTQHDSGGHSAYLMGKQSERGWWYYFPVVFAVKTPAAVLILLALCVVWGLVAMVRAGPGRWRLREVPFEWVVLALPPVMYFALCMRSHVNIGVRHILPVYPFLFVALAAALGRRNWGKRALAALVLVLAVESAAIWPHYLAFFNGFAGGPDKGPEYLVDSNLDWGQDLYNLKKYVAAHQIKRLCVCYFGHASMQYYKIDYLYLPATGEMEERGKMDCVAAVSATQLEGAYVGEEAFRWLRERTPMAKVGYSIYLYDFRRR